MINFQFLNGFDSPLVYLVGVQIKVFDDDTYISNIIDYYLVKNFGF